MLAVSRRSSPMSVGLALALCLPPLLAVTHARAADGRWYLGLGGSAARLSPDSAASGFEVDEELVPGATLFVGVDLERRGGAQVQLHLLGEGGFEGGEPVDYLGGDASVLYRVLDSRERAPLGTTRGASLYGRVGLGILSRDSDVRLANEAGVHLGVGIGAEAYLTRTLALRAEGLYHDTDASSLSLSLVARFGGRASARPPWTPPRAQAPTPPSPADARPDVPAPLPSTLPDATPAPEVPDAPPGAASPPDTRVPPAASAAPAGEPLSSPPGAGASRGDTSPAAPGTALGTAADRSVPAATASTAGDADGDGVADAADACPRSARGFPVRDDGCALLDGVLNGLIFRPGTAELEPGGTAQLDHLAGLLAAYPAARIKLHAHTDDAGTVREQSILSRARLRTIGVYLVQRHGVRANRLVLRSFGGIRPLHDNASEEGRRLNNRIEVLEDTD